MSQSRRNLKGKSLWKLNASNFIYANSPGLSGCLPYTESISHSSLRVTKTPESKKVWTSCPQKNKDLSSICSKILKLSGFLCLYYGFWLHFLARCTLFVANKKKKVSSLLLLERGRGVEGDRGTRVFRFPYHVLPPPVLLCPFTSRLPPFIVSLQCSA